MIKTNIVIVDDEPEMLSILSTQRMGGFTCIGQFYGRARTWERAYHNKRA